MLYPLSVPKIFAGYILYRKLKQFLPIFEKIRTFGLNISFMFTIYMAQCVGEKGSKATGWGFEHRYRLYSGTFYTGNYTKSTYFQKIWDFRSKIFLWYPRYKVYRIDK